MSTNKEQETQITEELMRKTAPNKTDEKRSNRVAIITAVVSLLAFIIVLAIIVIPRIVPPATPSGDGNSTPPSASHFDGPLNMPGDRIVIGANGAAETSTDFTPAATTFSSEPFTPREDGKVVVSMYFDPQCPACKLFEDVNGETLTKLLRNNTIVLELHPIAFLDSQSTTHYSSRAMNSLACVADTSPNSFYTYFQTIYENQPREGGDGLPDSRLIELAENAGATNVTECITSQKFNPWVQEATIRALTGPLPQTSHTGGVERTPFVFINGELFDGPITDSNALEVAIQEAKQ